MLYKDIYSFTPTGKIENDLKVFLLKYKKRTYIQTFNSGGK